MPLLFALSTIFTLVCAQSRPPTFVNVTLWTSPTDQIATITGLSLKEHIPEGFDTKSLIIRGEIAVLHENSVSGIDNVSELFFQQNQIGEIEPGAFRNLSGLRTLVINQSNLTKINEGVFGGLDIEQLQVSFNEIGSISNEAFRGLPKLKRLILWHNRLKELPEGVFRHLEALELLDLSENEISGFHREIFRGLPQLKMLLLRRNRIADVPTDYLDNLPLNYLDLSGNLISTLPGFLDTLPMLVSIGLSHNRITAISTGVFNNQHLHQVELDHNQISTIESDAFDNMTTLSNILLSSNQISHYDPKWFNNSTGIYRLFLSDNLIEELPDEAFSNIANDEPKWIKLDGNKMKAVSSKTFNGLKKLDYLNLANNNIEEWRDDFLVDVENVHYLNLMGNKIACPEGDPDEIFVADFTYLGNNPLTEECVGALEKWLQKEQRVCYKSPCFFY